MALAYTNRGDYDEAEATVRKALVIEPLNNELKQLKERIKQEKKSYIVQQKELGRKIFALDKKKQTIACKDIIGCFLSFIFSLIVIIILKIVQPILWMKNFVMKHWIVKMLARFIKVPIQIIKFPFMVMSKYFGPQVSTGSSTT
eukprot:TRINITY_DN3010_c0_g2_i1.p2 TRINITY_DN3010_c0_g2~~TRINITY_DN3010_c0_g2_i1.p2  ORF type:complete len:144 (-),score=17.14 TRINITY_DN3010_c0_g2_i1:120-551(-)